MRFLSPPIIKHYIFSFSLKLHQFIWRQGGNSILLVVTRIYLNFDVDIFHKFAHHFQLFSSFFIFALYSFSVGKLIFILLT